MNMISILLLAVSNTRATIQIGEHGIPTEVYVGKVDTVKEFVTICWANNISLDYSFEHIKQVNNCKILEMEK